MHAWVVSFWGIIQLFAFFSTFKMGDVDVIKVLDAVTITSVALVFAAKYFSNVDLALAFKSATGEIMDSGSIAMNEIAARHFHRIVIYPGDIEIKRTLDLTLLNFTLDNIVTPWRSSVSDTYISTSAALSPLFHWTVDPADEVSSHISDLIEGHAQDFGQYAEFMAVAQNIQAVEEVSLKDVKAPSVTVAASPPVDSDAQVPIIITITSLDAMVEGNITSQRPSDEDIISPKLAALIAELAQPGFFLKDLSKTLAPATIPPSRNISLQYSSSFIDVSSVEYNDSPFGNLTIASDVCPQNDVFVGYRYSIKPAMSALSYCWMYFKLGGQAIWNAALLLTDDLDELVDEMMSPPVLTHSIPLYSTPTIIKWFLDVLVDSPEEFGLGISGASLQSDTAPVHFDKAFELDELLHDNLDGLSSWMFLLLINIAMLVIVVLS